MLFKVKNQKFLFPIFLFFIILVTSVLALSYFGNQNTDITKVERQNLVNKDPEVSGWVAWWAEEKAYDLIKNNPEKIKSVSPVWFMINDNFELEEIGEIDRLKTIKELKENKIKILPTLGSELNGDELGPLLGNQSEVDFLIEDLVQEIKLLGVDGVDIDLEGVKAKDKKNMTSFLEKLSERARQENLILSITIHAQTGNDSWEGIGGQDLEKIGSIAGEVRIMTYDENSASTPPGSLASGAWIKKVMEYTASKIDRNKLVFGIPSYGYIWSESDSTGLQFDEFNKYLTGKNFTLKRDKGSAELVYSGKDFTGWLSDSEAMAEKIKFLQGLGFNRFVIWHLGGMDEKFYGKFWKEKS